MVLQTCRLCPDYICRSIRETVGGPLRVIAQALLSLPNGDGALEQVEAIAGHRTPFLSMIAEYRTAVADTLDRPSTSRSAASAATGLLGDRPRREQDPFADLIWPKPGATRLKVTDPDFNADDDDDSPRFDPAFVPRLWEEAHHREDQDLRDVIVIAAFA